MPPEIDFDAADLGSQLDSASLNTLEAQPYGIIRLDDNGLVSFYSRQEMALSGYKTKPTIGMNFFTDIAPCMNHPDMRGRIDQARKAGSIDIEMGWVGDFDNRSREIIIRAVSAHGGGFWLALDRR